MVSWTSKELTYILKHGDPCVADYLGPELFHNFNLRAYYPLATHQPYTHTRHKRIRELSPKSRQRFYGLIADKPHTRSTVCWHWWGTYNEEGRATYNHLHAARVLWCLEYDEDPGSWLVLHRCHNVGCVRPAHLYLGTAKDNMRDCVKSGRYRWHSPLTAEDREAIRESRELAYVLADRYGITASTVNNIRYKRRYNTHT